MIIIIVHCFSWQDVSHEDIPIMLVGNKSDLRQDGIGCVPASYGEKLAMVITNKNPLFYQTFTFTVTCYTSNFERNYLNCNL